MVCRHVDKFAAIRINRGQDSVTVVQKICDKWFDLDLEFDILNYSLIDDEDLILDNDDNLVMFGLVESAGLDDIMVTVRDDTNGFMNDTVKVGNIKFDVASGSKGKQVMVVDDDDVIPSFCSQKK
ncbi:hypothetical protein RHGRI_025991 [Rhododendron griersonianum]|uniref:Transposase n=1 Tax=Rhododendron griersonianum TaxID=479676 RepID=A0AAV6ITH0_9ERIC|nr:hypothetical protein RHGRI_025991 [Rhododendron griersonianum]